MHERCITGLCDRVRNLGRIAVQVCGCGCPQQALGLAHIMWEQREQYPVHCLYDTRMSRIVLPFSNGELTPQYLFELE